MCMTPEQFRKLSALAFPLIPHDEAMLMLWPCGKQHGLLLLSIQGTDPRVEELNPPGESDVVRLLTEDDARAHGFASGVRVPLRVKDVGGYLTFLARQEGAYGNDTLSNSMILAAYLSSVLLHDHGVAKMSEDLINTLADVLDIREVFPQVSKIVAEVLPHDLLAVAFDDTQSSLEVHVATHDEVAPLDHLRLKVTDLFQALAVGYKVVGDLATEHLPVAEPVHFQTHMLAAATVRFSGSSKATVPLHLTDDRSAQALASVAQLDFGKTIAPAQIDPAALKLLNFKFGGSYLIPSAQSTRYQCRNIWSRLLAWRSISGAMCGGTNSSGTAN